MDVPSGWKLVPIEPTNEMLEALVTNCWPEDAEAGMKLKLKQFKTPSFPADDMVPSWSEMECAVGKWYRVLESAPDYAPR